MELILGCHKQPAQPTYQDVDQLTFTGSVPGPGASTSKERLGGSHRLTFL